MGETPARPARGQAGMAPGRAVFGVLCDFDREAGEAVELEELEGSQVS
jgi:hypothetical protein